MIDDAIETRLIALAKTVYPTLKDDQIIVKFPQATLAPRIDLAGKVHGRGNLVGTETIDVELFIGNEDKLDRELLQRELYAGRLTLEGKKVTEFPNRIRQMDYVDVIKNQGIIFYIEYKHEINKAT